MISTRYSAAVIALASIALVPVAMHSYLGARTDDGRSVRAVPTTLAGMTSKATERRASWVQNTFDSADWIERTYRSGGKDVVLFAARSYDPKRLYHHPELAVLRGTATEPAGVQRVRARPDIPLHVLRTERNGHSGVAVYALLHDGHFVDDPILFQLKTAASLLVSGRKPMTLFLASDLAGAAVALEDAPSTRVLLAAVEAFEAQPPAAENAGR